MKPSIEQCCVDCMTIEVLEKLLRVTHEEQLRVEEAYAEKIMNHALPRHAQEN